MQGEHGRLPAVARGLMELDQEIGPADCLAAGSGVLARRYGIRVTFADSPWLGTSVVVVVPHKYFSPLPVTAVAEPPPCERAATTTAARTRELGFATSELNREALRA
ncbi:hypothetical protein [Streptomyces sp. NPDC005009]